MYTLTEISEKGTTHQSLGCRFVVLERELCKVEFEKAYNTFYGNPEKILPEENINEQIYCLIVSENGKDILPLYKYNFYYIVTDNGKTFKNLTYK